jgi:hypothetical protein
MSRKEEMSLNDLSSFPKISLYHDDGIPQPLKKRPILSRKGLIASQHFSNRVSQNQPD